MSNWITRLPELHSPLQNRLLATLPLAEFKRLEPHLELVEVALGKALYESSYIQQYVYFPTSCIISMLYVLEDGASAEIAIVGNEGLLGVSLFMGGETTPSRAVVQSSGFLYRIKPRWVIEEFNRTGPVQRLMLRYTQALMTQMTQTAVCNRHHSIDQQLCRWLLMSLDRLSNHKLTMTQSLIANMLGVRREGVTEAAGKLQKVGLIRYARGRIDVLDRPGLEKRVCECYGVVKQEFTRLLGNIAPGDPHQLLGKSSNPSDAKSDVDKTQMAHLIEANGRLVLVALEAQRKAESANSKLDKLSIDSQMDVLTKTPNRALMLDRLKSALALALRRGKRAAVLFIDLDGFKQINDTLGHAAGDMVLITVAHRLEACVRDSDAVSRHGGDEFLVLLSEISQASDAALIAKKMLADIAAPIAEEGQTLHTKMSMGIAIFPDDSQDASELIKFADFAMYRSKQSGGGCYTFYVDEEK